MYACMYECMYMYMYVYRELVQVLGSMSSAQALLGRCVCQLLYRAFSRVEATASVYMQYYGMPPHCHGTV